MPIQRKITINHNSQQPLPRATYAPNPLAAKTRDQIFWTNNDDQAHWPGLLNDNGTINPTFFMPNQIAPNGDSSQSFSPTLAGTFKYECALHKGEGEEGTITVT